MTPNPPKGAAARLLALGLLWAAAATGCRLLPPPPEAPPPLAVLQPSDYPEFSDDLDFDALDAAIEQSLIYLARLPEDRVFSFGADRYDAKHLRRSLERFRAFLAGRPEPERLRRFIREHYAVYQSPGRPPDGDVLFTGYYETLFPGSLTPSPEYPVPVYGQPADLIKVDLSLFSEQWTGHRIAGRVDGNRLLPYYTRREIVEGEALTGKAQVVAWMQDPVDLYFLQVQGSGKLVTPSGDTVGIHYADKNGQPARLVGGSLIAEGKIPREEMSMQKIREYFQNHPEDIPRLLNADPSYVFFRVGEGGPFGSIAVQLTPGRSIATDSRLFPPGALAFIETEKPVVPLEGVVEGWVPLRRFVLNQDTGGLIRGPGRVDLFWGSGPYAETAAGHMKQPGRLFFLVLRPDAALDGTSAGTVPLPAVFGRSPDA